LTLPYSGQGDCAQEKYKPELLKDLTIAADTSGMTKSAAASVVCLLPLVAACPEVTSPCVDLGMNVLVEVSKDSAAENVGDCAVPPAFRLAALGCNVGTTYSADKCVVEFDLMCIGGVNINLDVTQTRDDGVVGTLHKVDTTNDCTLDLEITIKNTPAPTPEAEKK
jgi:hypothetical protein